MMKEVIKHINELTERIKDMNKIMMNIWENMKKT